MLAGLDGRIAAVLDGGPCRVGVESTIVDCTGTAPRILRPGGVSASDVADAGEVDVDDSPSPVRAPGTLASHYAPAAQVRLVDAKQVAALVAPPDVVLEVQRMLCRIDQCQAPTQPVFV